jgi:hypothetical protein
MRLLECVGLHYPTDYTLIRCGLIWAHWDMLQKDGIDAGLHGA